MILQKIYLSSKCSSEHVECSFDNSAENFPPKVPKKSETKKYFDKNIFHQIFGLN